MIPLSRIAPAVLGLIIFAAAIAPAAAQQEFSPPQGKGRLVVLFSGSNGAPPYRGVAWQIAQLGYDAVLFDGNTIRGAEPWKGAEDAALRTAIKQAQQMPHALPGKVGLVGFSLGGGQVLFYGSQMSELAAVVVAWYPVTRFIDDLSGFVGRLRLPVLILAGEADTHSCCPIGTARALAAAATGRQFELVSYPKTNHSFIYGGDHYNPEAYADAMQRTAAKLAQYLGR